MGKVWKNLSGTARKRLADFVTAGVAVCSKCGQPVEPGQAWDVDHRIPQDVAPHLIDAPSNWAIAHRSCNRSAGAAYGNRKRAGTLGPKPIPPPSRIW